MRLPIAWLRDYLDVTLSVDDLVERLAALGFPVDGIEHRPRLRGIVVGRLIAVEPHPNADRLRVCRVDVAGGEPLGIATGAANVAVGDVVPVATIGAELLDLEGRPLRIEPRRMRGFESQGMLCSAAELGLEGEWFEDGILQLDPSTPLGTDVVERFGLADAVLDVDVTANRVDAMCVFGLARELAAALHPRAPRATDLARRGRRVADRRRSPRDAGISRLPALRRAALLRAARRRGADVDASPSGVGGTTTDQQSRRHLELRDARAWSIASLLRLRSPRGRASHRARRVRRRGHSHARRRRSSPRRDGAGHRRRRTGSMPRRSQGLRAERDHRADARARARSRQLLRSARASHESGAGPSHRRVHAPGEDDAARAQRARCRARRVLLGTPRARASTRRSRLERRSRVRRSRCALATSKRCSAWPSRPTRSRPRSPGSASRCAATRMGGSRSRLRPGVPTSSSSPTSSRRSAA